MNARDVVKALLRPYAERGDAYESIRIGNMGWNCDKGTAHCHLDKVTVDRIGPYASGTPCHEVFSLRAIYDELKKECQQRVKQPSLFGTEVPV